MARLLTPSGISRWVYSSNAQRRDFSLGQIQELLRGSPPDVVAERCSVIPVADFRYGTFHMIINQLAAHYGLPHNETASVLCRRDIRGPALLVADFECFWDNDPDADLLDDYL